jgi:hypothetical protein
MPNAQQHRHIAVYEENCQVHVLIGGINLTFAQRTLLHHSALVDTSPGHVA